MNILKVIVENPKNPMGMRLLLGYVCGYGITKGWLKQKWDEFISERGEKPYNPLVFDLDDSFMHFLEKNLPTDQCVAPSCCEEVVLGMEKG